MAEISELRAAYGEQQARVFVNGSLAPCNVCGVVPQPKVIAIPWGSGGRGQGHGCERVRCLVWERWWNLICGFFLV